MKKKILTSLLLTMIICIVGCGRAEESVEATFETVEETNTEESVEETPVEETTVEEVASTVVETTVEETTEEVVEDPTSESNSTAQIVKLLETYKGIMNSDDHIIKMAQDNCETFNGKWDMQGLFADGTTCQNTYSIFSIAIEYYSNCMAGNAPYDLKTWMSQQACEEDVLLMNFDNAESVAEGYEIKLFGAIYLCPYLANQSSIELVNRVETDEYKFVKGEVAAYTYDLVLSGVENTGFKAVYDSKGNLLTIVGPDDFVLTEEFYSFEQ